MKHSTQQTAVLMSLLWLILSLLLPFLLKAAGHATEENLFFVCVNLVLSFVCVLFFAFIVESRQEDRQQPQRRQAKPTPSPKKSALKRLLLALILCACLFSSCGTSAPLYKKDCQGKTHKRQPGGFYL